ncbi:MAG: hypothetical protein KDB22_29085 [Planctomycetales bacterium]|nr:hypothetical protein [Planctomycetales bacterium]
MMRSRNTVFLACALHIAQFTALGQLQAQSPVATTFPTSTAKRVFVKVDQSLLFSGPSQDYYSTTRLDKNAVLEVFTSTDDGWLGVRPPTGSFSWVQAADAYLLPGGKVIEITNPSAVSWIGSQLGAVDQFRWQVQLSAGEQLAILGEAKNVSKSGKETLWYRIAPPSGEFRWIREELVSPTLVAPSDDKRPYSTDTPSILESGKPSAVQSQPNGGVSTAGYVQAVDGETKQDEVFGDDSRFEQLPSPQAIPMGEGSTSEYYSSGGDIQYEGEFIVDGQHMGPVVNETYDEVYNDGYYTEGPVVQSSDPFAGWHAFEFTDDGLRFPFLERLFSASNRPAYDPLAEDPYNLQVASPRQNQTLRGVPRTGLMDTVIDGDSVSQVTGAPQTLAQRRTQPWRDPRNLRASRMFGQNIPSSLKRPDNRSLTAASDVDSSGLSTTSSEPSPLERAQRRVESMSLAVQNALNASDRSLDSTRDQWRLSGADSPKRLPDPDSLPPIQNEVHWFGVDPANRSSGQGSQARHGMDLDQLQVALSEMVVRPMETWDFSQLTQQVRAHVDNGANPIERGQARLLLERIEEFQTIANRNGIALRTSNVIGIAHNSTSSGTGGVSTAGYTNSLPPSNADSKYDATGWLVPVHAANPGQPPYALTNDSGAIVAYVTTTPGMNLDHHLNHAVGIRGLRGYLPQLQAGTIQAQHVSLLR